MLHLSTTISAMKKQTLLFSLVSFFFLLSCSSDDNDPTEPETSKNKQYSVNLTVNMAPGSEDADLAFRDISKVISKPRSETDRLGYKGLIVYCDKDRHITVYDLACPNCWDGNMLTKMSTPDNRYECKNCGLKGFAVSGFGTFDNKDGLVRFVKYDVTKIDTYKFDVTNPK